MPPAGVRELRKVPSARAIDVDGRLGPERCE